MAPIKVDVSDTKYVKMLIQSQLKETDMFDDTDPDFLHIIIADAKLSK